MKLLTSKELEAILKARNYTEITDQDGQGWLCHVATGKCFQPNDVVGQDYCEVIRSEASKKSNKKVGEYWFVHRDPDLNQWSLGAVEFEGEICLLTMATNRTSELYREERDALFDKMDK